MLTSGTLAWLVLQEAKRLLLARWMAGAVALLCASSVFSLVLGTYEFHQHHAAYQALLQERVEAQLAGTGHALGRSAEPGLRVIRAPAPGSVLAAGVETTLPAAWEFTPAGSEALAPYARSGTSAFNRGVGDLPGIIARFGGLLALWLGVSTMVADRAAGRIAQLRTLPVASGTVAAVRLAGGALAFTCVTAVWCLIVAFTIRVTLPADTELAPQVAVWIGVPVVWYLALMFTVGTGVGAVVRDGQTALITAVLAWFVSVFVLPPASQIAATSLVEVVPQNRMELARRERVADETRLLEQAVGDAIAKQWPDVRRTSDREQAASFGAIGEPIWTAGLSRIREAARLEERRWLEQRARADRVRRWLDGVNPATWLGESMAELAGTGRSLAANWRQAIATHDRALDTQLFSNRPRVNARTWWMGDGVTMAFDRRPAPRYADLPAFVPPPSGERVWTNAAIRGVAGLAVYSLLVMAAVYVALRLLLR